MKRFLTICVTVLLVAMAASAQRRISCIRPSDKSGTRGITELPKPPQLDPQKTYRQPVILIAFDDVDFSMDDPAGYYKRVFNESGFNEGKGLGCVADYFRDQSAGLFNLKFEIYGPFKVSIKAGGHGSKYYADDAQCEALKKLYQTESTNFSIYDWDGDGLVNQLVFVLAGFNGSEISGYTEPNTGKLTNSPKLPGDLYPYVTSVSCEMWRNRQLCGIGTIVHEYSHTLGLPDLYPVTGATAFSVVDEWDLMDGGNFTNYGWCPPNLSAMEKLYLGWAEPLELKSPTTITGMKSVADGGQTYIIRNSAHDDEYYLLENRRQKGWDYGVPGNGLLIFHVDYDAYSWNHNDVNTSDTHYRYDLFHADRKDYRARDPSNTGDIPNKWTLDPRLRNKFLSTSPYPYTDASTLVVNASLTNDSDPAASLYNVNAEGVKLMSKPITNIQLAADGTISFDFMGGTSAINGIQVPEVKADVWYDLQGRRLYEKPVRKGLYIHNGKKESIR